MLQKIQHGNVILRATNRPGEWWGGGGGVASPSRRSAQTGDFPAAHVRRLESRWSVGRVTSVEIDAERRP